MLIRSRAIIGASANSSGSEWRACMVWAGLAPAREPPPPILPFATMLTPVYLPDAPIMRFKDENWE